MKFSLYYVGRQLAGGNISRCYLRQLAGIRVGVPHSSCAATSRVGAAPTYPRFVYISSQTNLSCAATSRVGVAPTFPILKKINYIYILLTF